MSKCLDVPAGPIQTQLKDSCIQKPLTRRLMMEATELELKQVKTCKVAQKDQYCEI